VVLQLHFERFQLTQGCHISQIVLELCRHVGILNTYTFAISDIYYQCNMKCGWWILSIILKLKTEIRTSGFHMALVEYTCHE
jgi:hypothetical protein